MDFAKYSKVLEALQKKDKSVPIADSDKWMAQFEKLLNVPRSAGYVAFHMSNVHPADLPSAAALTLPFTLMKLLPLHCSEAQQVLCLIWYAI